ncbi:hypothetical protein [Hydrogenophaga sp.]
MAHVIADRVLESSITAGTGVFTLAGAVLGFRAFTAVCAVADTVPYYIEAVDDVGRPTGEYEYGLGTYSAANQLTRTTVRGSSNGGLAVSFAAGTKLVGLGIPAPNSAATRLEWRNSLGFTALGNTLATVADQAAAQAAVGVTPRETGEVVSFARSSAPTGWVKANGGTIGSAASGATLRANADTLALYTLLWNEFPQAILAIQTSAGGASTRGASAAADFAANKRLPVHDLRGEFPRGWDDGRGVDGGRALGSAQSHAFQQHSHAYSVGVGGTGGANPAYTPVGATSGDTASTALAGAPNTETRPRNVALLYCIKL